MNPALADRLLATALARRAAAGRRGPSAVDRYAANARRAIADDGVGVSL